MKNTTKQKLGRNQPSEKTRWAYWMQAIEPTSETINKAFSDYHPQWVQNSQMLTVAPENFKAMRISLGMTINQCAAYLRVTEGTVRIWEKGINPVPFAEFELLRLVLESIKFKLSNVQWDGWFISADGALNSPDIGGAGFTPEQLVWSSMSRNEAALLSKELEKLKVELSRSVSENTTLRQLFLNNGVVDEVAAMKKNIDTLMSRINTAKIIPFQVPIKADQALEKTA